MVSEHRCSPQHCVLSHWLQDSPPLCSQVTLRLSSWSQCGYQPALCQQCWRVGWGRALAGGWAAVAPHRAHLQGCWPEAGWLLSEQWKGSGIAAGWPGPEDGPAGQEAPAEDPGLDNRQKMVLYRWVSARKMKLQCVSNGVTSFLH